MASAATVGGTIGPNTDAVDAGVASGGVYPTGLGAKIQLGTRLVGADGVQYIYVQAGSASSAMASADAPNAYAIDKDFRARLMTTARAAAGQGLGFGPPAVIAAHDYFYARVGGYSSAFTARVAASASADKWLRTTIVKGRLGTASTASACVFPVMLVTAASASSASSGQTVRAVYASTLSTVGQQAIANALAPV